MREGRFSGPSLCSSFFNFRFGTPETGSIVRETGSIWDGDRFAGPRIGVKRDADIKSATPGRQLLQEPDAPLLLGP